MCRAQTDVKWRKIDGSPGAGTKASSEHALYTWRGGNTLSMPQSDEDLPMLEVGRVVL